MTSAELIHTLKKIDHRFTVSAANGQYKDHGGLWYLTRDGMEHEFVCGMPLGQIPEYDIMSKRTGEVIKRGWRNILRIVMHSKLFRPGHMREKLKKHGFTPTNMRGVIRYQEDL